MTNTELITILKQKFGKAKNAAKGWIRIPCPTCSPRDSKKMKRYVSSTRDYSHCYICDKRLHVQELIGDSAVFVRDVRHITEKVEELHVAAKRMPGTKFIPINQLSVNHPVVKFLNKDYLYDLNRYAEEFGAVYCPGDGGEMLYAKPYITTAERLIFPVTYNSELVGWQARSIPGTTFGDYCDEKLRYIHLFDKGNYLYNFDNAKKFEMAILVEGVKKAWKFPNAVATLGKGISQNQIQLLYNWKNLTILFDGEKETQDQARELQHGLNIKRVINIDLRKYTDKDRPSPDDFTEDELASIVWKAWNK